MSLIKSSIVFGTNFPILMDSQKRSTLKKVWRIVSNLAFVAIIAILLVPSWRVPFQGWFQGIFMGATSFSQNLEKSLPHEVLNWQIESIEGIKQPFQVYTDKPIVMSFWATWCPPCRAELKSLASLKKEIGMEAHFISVSEESKETIVASGLPKTYDFLYRTTQFPAFFEVDTYPTVCIIDQHQVMVYRHEGVGDIHTEKNVQFIRELAEKG